MPKYLIEHREAFENPYLKVKLKDNSNLDKVQKLLKNLQSIKNINITPNNRTDITVYPSDFFNPSETEQEIKVQLESFFSTQPFDPVFEETNIPSISDKAYEELIKEINIFGHNLEKYKGLYSKFDENGFRDFFLPHLNSISKQYSATGETFNKVGKTDILIQDNKSDNLFVAECKIWHGEQELLNAIDQLIERYVTWRDECTALIIFNKQNKDFSAVLSKAKNSMEKHPLHVNTNKENLESSISYTFKNSDDPNKKIKLELIIFNCT